MLEYGLAFNGKLAGRARCAAICWAVFRSTVDHFVTEWHCSETNGHLMKPWLTLISPWGGLALGLVLTSITWQSARDNAYRNHERQFDMFAEFARAELTNRLQRCEEAVGSVALLFEASEHVDHREWNTVINGLRIPQRRTGLASLAFANADALQTVYQWTGMRGRSRSEQSIWIQPAMKIVAKAQSGGSCSLAAEGLTVLPYSEDCRHLVLIHTVSRQMESSELPDVNESERRDDGTTSDRDGSGEHGKRRLRGWAIGVIDLAELTRNVWEHASPQLRLRLFGSSPEAARLLYDNQTAGAAFRCCPLFNRSLSMSGLGAAYWLEVSSLPDFEASVDRTWPVVVFLTGLSVSGLLFGLLWSAHHTRDLAEKMAAEMTDALRARERELNEYTVALQQANREIEAHAANALRASEAKSMFLANTSHELRTPLTAILGYAEMLRHDDAMTPDLKRQSLETIVQGADHLLHLIDDLLDLSKVESGSMTIDKQSCSLFEAVSAVGPMIRERANQKGLDFSVECAEDLPESIVTDARRLRQILINLLGNAVKFSESGRVRLLIRRAADSPEQIEFVVEDSGSGMTEEELSRVFQPFVQAHRHISTNYGGTGLGLAISRQLAEMLGGTLTAESRIGVGSTFTLRLPSGARASDAGTDPANPIPDRGKSIDLSGRRILLAEDSIENSRLISLILRKAGATVDCATNGHDACAAVRSPSVCYDLILMDLEMPLLDGAAATRQLRAEGYSAPIIGLTAHAFGEAKQRCLEAGCNEFATKPIRREALLSLVARHLRDQAAKRN